MNFTNRGNSSSAVNQISPPHGRSTTLRCSRTGRPFVVTVFSIAGIPASDLLSPVPHKLLDPIEAPRQLRNGSRVRDPDMFSRPEGFARNNRDLRLGQELL